MNIVMYRLAIPLNALMGYCYRLSGNYVLAILVFTLLTKLILLPLSLWLHRNGIKMVEMMPEINHLKIKHFGDKDTIAEETQKLYKRVNYHPLASTIPMIIQVVLLMGVIEAVKQLLGSDTENILLLIPSQAGGVTLLMPLAAGIAAFLLVVAQNKIAPLQKEQEKAEQIMTGAISVGISLFLGAFVSLGTGVYWIASNLFSILNQLVCNALIKPDKYIDYQVLAESKKELAEMSELGSKISPEDKKREKADYKRFFSVANKHLVFYSESSGFYKYYQGIIECLLSHSNVTIHYVTSDPKDAIFQMAETNKQIRAYYIGEKKLITLFMKMDADMVVMTMPDIENFHIKRSYVRKDIEYVYIPHGIDSINLTMRTGCIDHYDTVFCVGKHHNEEIEKTEEVYGLPHKKLIDFGYCLLDSMREAYWSKEHEEKEEKTILIAPSWQVDNIVDTCLDEMLVALSGHGYHIIVRPHPQQVRHCPVRMEQLKARFANHSDIEIQTDFSSNSTVFEADMVITDWSGIAYEYAFTTYKPVIFVDTPMKVMNPEYKRIDVEPINIWMRETLGAVLKTEQIGQVSEIVCAMFENELQHQKAIQGLVEEYVYNFGRSAEVGGKYILQSLREHQKATKR